MTIQLWCIHSLLRSLYVDPFCGVPRRHRNKQCTFPVKIKIPVKQFELGGETFFRKNMQYFQARSISSDRTPAGNELVPRIG